MKNLKKIWNFLFPILAIIGLFLFVYRMSTGTDPGTPIELHNPFGK